MNTILKDCLLFKDITLTTLNFDYKILNLDKNEQIQHKVNDESFIGIIIEGEISVNKVFVDGKTIKINSLFPGDLFGICNLFYDEEMPSILTTKSQSKILCISKKIILSLFKQNEKILENYSFICNKKIFFLNKKIEFYNMSSTEKKVIHYILSSAKNNILYINFNKSELANLLSISRASLYRELNKLKALKYIEFKTTNTLKITNKPKLISLLKQ